MTCQALKANPNSATSPSHMIPATPDNDDTFQLWDLVVEAICPPGERILCGAKNGDSFRLEGEMLYLPPGQGFSIYSLGTSLYIPSFMAFI